METDSSAQSSAHSGKGVDSLHRGAPPALCRRYTLQLSWRRRRYMPCAREPIDDTWWENLSSSGRVIRISVAVWLPAATAYELNGRTAYELMTAQQRHEKEADQKGDHKERQAQSQHRPYADSGSFGAGPSGGPGAVSRNALSLRLS